MASPDALRGHVDAMLLSVLAEGPIHGYGAIERILERSGGELDFPSGTVYPALKRLELKGWIAAKWETSEHNRRARRELVEAPGQLVVDRVVDLERSPCDVVVEGPATPHVQAPRVVGPAVDGLVADPVEVGLEA